MISALAFAAGFAAGWITRSSLDASRSASVQLVAFGLETIARIKRALAIEREQLEDLVAEAQEAAARRHAERGVERSAAEAAPVEHAA
jgi:hypothetical protein